VNLIKNAIEAATFAGRSPVIRLSVRLEGETAWLSVADNGPGISPIEMRRIFEAGYSTKGSGRGLGLAIVRESIAAQGGSLDVKSQPESGTEFRIGLKLA
jgi:C4-dicarboxylate-specific signal transduction histidine kinase